jgi:MFS family permease
MITLIMLGSVLNYLTRNTLSVAQVQLKDSLGISEAQYSWITGAFQIMIMLQPICGYVLDVVGLRIGFAIFATAWSLINMAHALAGSWKGLAFLRGVMGFAEGSANPAGMKATAEWFPARERGFAGGVYNIGASAGSMLAGPLVAFAVIYLNWQSAFVISGGLGLVWVPLAPALSVPFPASLAVRQRTGLHYIRTGKSAHGGRTAVHPGDHPAAQFLGDRDPAFSGRPHLGHIVLLAAAVSRDRAELGDQANSDVCVAAVPGGGLRLHFRGLDSRDTAKIHGCFADKRPATCFFDGRGPDDQCRVCRPSG